MSETVVRDIPACALCGSVTRASFEKRGYGYRGCPSCGTLAMCPLPSGEEIEAHYRAKFQGGNYELLRRFSSQYRVIYEGFLERVGRTFAADGLSLRGLRVLEVGCFTGDFLELAAGAGCDVRGFELQDEAVAIAQQRLPGRVTKTDVHDKNIDGHAYDAVCLFGVVEHVTEPSNLVKRCAELLKPGGWLFVQTPDSGSWPALLLGRYWPPVSPVEHIHLMSRAALRRCLGQAGLTGISFEAHFKRLPVEYVFEMMNHFGPELRRIASPLYACLPGVVRRSALPFYGGEMFVKARKAPSRT